MVTGRLFKVGADVVYNAVKVKEPVQDTAKIHLQDTAENHVKVLTER